MKLTDTVDLASTLVKIKQHQPGEFIDKDREATVLGAVLQGQGQGGSSTDGNMRKPPLPNKVKNHKEDNEDGQSIITNVTTDTFLAPKNAKSDMDVLLDKINKGPSVGQHVLHTGRRDEENPSHVSNPSIPKLEPLDLKDIHKFADNNESPMVTGASEKSKSFFLTILTDEDRITNNPNAKIKSKKRGNTNPNNAGSLPSTPVLRASSDRKQVQRPTTGDGNSGRRTMNSGRNKSSTNPLSSRVSDTLNRMSISAEGGKVLCTVVVLICTADA